jgi:hypothetical protein
MTRALWPIVTVLALLAGIPGCFPYLDWRRGEDGGAYGDRHYYTSAYRDPPGRDCWQQNDDWVCRRGD